MPKKEKEFEPRMTVTLGYVGYPLDITLEVVTNVECNIQEERDMIAAMIGRLAEELAELHPAHEYSPSEKDWNSNNIPSARYTVG